jgi:hypothetical protein
MSFIVENHRLFSVLFSGFSSLVCTCICMINFDRKMKVAFLISLICAVMVWAMFIKVLTEVL